MTSHLIHSDGPDRWSVPRASMMANGAHVQHGKILPMHEPSWLSRIWRR